MPVVDTRGAVVLSDRERDPASPSPTPTSSPRERFAESLRSKFRDRNYANAYIARRCRTTEGAVASWLSGADLPTRDEWSYLAYVSRDFSRLESLWCEAWEDRDPPCDVSREVAAPIDPGIDAPIDARVDVRVVAPGSEASGSIRGPSASPRPAAATMTSRTSPGYASYTCKISGGRFVVISLPLEFSRLDASRVYAFLLTQVDDFVPAESGHPDQMITADKQMKLDEEEIRKLRQIVTTGHVR